VALVPDCNASEIAVLLFQSRLTPGFFYFSIARFDLAIITFDKERVRNTVREEIPVHQPAKGGGIMKFLKMFVTSLVTGLLLSWAVPTLSDTLSSLDGVGNTTHRLVKISEGVKKELQKDPSWRTCGDYFARRDEGGERVAFFFFEKGPFTAGPSRNIVFAYTDIHGMNPLANTEKDLSTVFVRDNEQGRKFQIKMNLEDYATWLSCFGKGRKYWG
jgi:hypothetical protein